MTLLSGLLVTFLALLMANAVHARVESVKLVADQSQPSLSYVAAVVQHDVLVADSPMDTMLLNLASYHRDAQSAAAKGAQVIVFPEFGLISPYDLKECTVNASSKSSFPSTIRSEESNSTAVSKYCVIVPSVGDNPCGDMSNNFSSVIVQSSCIARNASLVASINLCEKSVSNSSHYNTQVVFDETGVVAAVYRKTHVFFHGCFDEPSHTEVVFFLSSFGVHFGIFTCYDILFEQPARTLLDKGIKHFLYSASIPVVGSLVQGVWSYNHSTVLLASNLGKMESGVYDNGMRITPPAPKAGECILLSPSIANV